MPYFAKVSPLCFDRIEALSIKSGSNVVIIDNITALCAACEADLLKERNERAERDKKIFELHNSGYSLTEITKETRLSFNTVRGIYRRAKGKGKIARNNDDAETAIPFTV